MNHTQKIPSKCIISAKNESFKFRQMVSRLLISHFENYWEFTVSAINFARHNIENVQSVR